MHCRRYGRIRIRHRRKWSSVGVQRDGKWCRGMRIWLTVVLALAQLASAQVPQAAIANARIRATLYMPDARSGYYRGTRFDWSGVVASLDWKGHSYFGQWFERYDPTLHDAITGPVEEFLTNNAALGYDEAKQG